MFVGYCLNSTTYRLLVFDSKVSEISDNTIIESRDAIFFENIFPMKNKLSRPICEESNFDFSFNKEGGTNDQACNEPRKSKRRRKNKNFGDDFCTCLLEDDPKT